MQIDQAGGEGVYPRLAGQELASERMADFGDYDDARLAPLALAGRA
jgi:hypothetical protein